MNKGYIRLVVLMGGLFFSAFDLTAQQNHFIYLQTENKQPFYLKLDKKILSSSASGYLIVPKLQDGNYTFTIGFPKNEWPEQYLSYNINKKDEGFLLKSFDDKGWGLFNLQTMEVVMAGKNPLDIKEVVAIVNKDTVTILAPAVVIKDTVVVNVPDQTVGLKEEATPISSQKITKPEPAVESANVVKEAEKMPVNEVNKKEESPAAVSQIKKLFSVTSLEGSDLVYADIVNGHADTIRLFIPAEKKNELIIAPQTQKKPREEEEAVKKEVAQKEKPVITQSGQQEQKEEAAKKESPKFIDIELSRQKPDTANQIRPVVQEEKESKAVVVEEAVSSRETISKPVIVNSDCKNLATDDDFLKLRKKMAAEDKDDDMINVARKVFKTRCFTTEQVKNLSVLFLKDEGKYRFFDTVYPFVSDSYNFSTLQIQLTEDYFISRFKAMIRH